jgi:hypothetical protein
MHFDNQWRTTFRLFWFCAGADHHELEQPACSTDRNRYAGLGAFVFLTAIMAGVSAGYALSFVFHSLVAALIGGLLWAVMIFSFDRFMVQSIRKSRGGRTAFGPAVLRVVLSILIATVISAPLELTLFHQEIDAELLKDANDSRTQQEASNGQDLGIRQMKADIETLKQQIKGKQGERDRAHQAAVDEGLGRAGTLVPGAGRIYGAKTQFYEQVQKEYVEVEQRNHRKIENLEDKVAKREEILGRRVSDSAAAASADHGILRRLVALRELERDPVSGTMVTVTVTLVFLLFLLIETGPVVAKLLTPYGPYDAALERGAADGIEKQNQLRRLESAQIEHSAENQIASMRQFESLKGVALKEALVELQKHPDYQSLKEGMVGALLSQMRHHFGLIVPPQLNPMQLPEAGPEEQPMIDDLGSLNEVELDSSPEAPQRSTPRSSQWHGGYRGSVQ